MTTLCRPPPLLRKMCATACPSASAFSTVIGSLLATPRTPSVPNIFRRKRVPLFPELDRHAHGRIPDDSSMPLAQFHPHVFREVFRSLLRNHHDGRKGFQPGEFLRQRLDLERRRDDLDFRNPAPLLRPSDEPRDDGDAPTIEPLQGNIDRVGIDALHLDPRRDADQPVVHGKHLLSRLCAGQVDRRGDVGRLERSQERRRARKPDLHLPLHLVRDRHPRGDVADLQRNDEPDLHLALPRDEPPQDDGQPQCDRLEPHVSPEQVLEERGNVRQPDQFRPPFVNSRVRMSFRSIALSTLFTCRSWKTVTFPVSSEITTATASVSAETPHPARCRVPMFLTAEDSAGIGRITPAAATRSPRMTTAPSCTGDLVERIEASSSCEKMASSFFPCSTYSWRPISRSIRRIPPIRSAASRKVHCTRSSTKSGGGGAGALPKMRACPILARARRISLWKITTRMMMSPPRKFPTSHWNVTIPSFLERTNIPIRSRRPNSICTARVPRMNNRTQ